MKATGYWNDFSLTVTAGITGNIEEILLTENGKMIAKSNGIKWKLSENGKMVFSAPEESGFSLDGLYTDALRLMIQAQAKYINKLTLGGNIR